MHKNPVVLAIGLMLAVAIALAASLAWPVGGPTTSQPQPAAVREGPLVLRFGHNIPVDSALHQAAMRFAEEVGRKSAGRVRVDVYPAQQLGTDDQMMEMARRGSLDILLTPTAKISASVPAMQLADLPFFFPTRQDLYAVLDGEPGRLLLDKLREIDLIGVTFWENGFKHFTGNRPLHRPEDFAGLKVRIMKSRMLMEQFRALGAQPISIDFHATRQALADGVVDGQENPLVAIVSMGLHEVQPHLTLSSHGYLGYVFMISARVFEALPPDIRRLLVETARDLTPWEREETRRAEQGLLETIRKAGVTVHELTEPERRRFAAATAHIPAMFEDVIGPDLLSSTEALLDARAAPADRIVVGLDADLSTDSRVAGLAIKRGARLAIEEINAAGGVLGRPLALLARDHKGMPSQGIHNMQLFAAQADVVAVLGGVHSAVILPEMTTVQEAGLPYLIPWATGESIVKNGWIPNSVFRLSATDRLVAPFLVDRIKMRYHRPAILVENSIWGRDGGDKMRQRLTAHGLAPVLVETFNRGEADFAPRMTRIERSGADVLLIIANAYEGEGIIRAVAEMRAPIPVVSHWGITTGTLGQTDRRLLSKVGLTFLQTFLFPNNPRPAAQALEHRYQARYMPDEMSDGAHPVPAPQGVAQAYDLVHLLALAIRQAGSTDRAAVRQALEHLPIYEGAVRTYAPAFTPERHDALDTSDYHLARYGDDGAIVPVDP